MNNSEVTDDGVPYECIGDGLKDIYAEATELRLHMVWIPAPASMIFELKQLIRHLHSIHGMTGLYFLRSLGIENIDDLSPIDGIKAVTVCDMIEEAILCMSEDDRILLGWQRPHDA